MLLNIVIPPLLEETSNYLSLWGIPWRIYVKQTNKQPEAKQTHNFQGYCKCLFTNKVIQKWTPPSFCHPMSVIFRPLCYIFAGNCSIYARMSSTLPRIIRAQRPSCEHAISHMLTPRLPSERLQPLLQLQHWQLTATACCCSTPLLENWYPVGNIPPLCQKFSLCSGYAEQLLITVSPMSVLRSRCWARRRLQWQGRATTSTPT